MEVTAIILLAFEKIIKAVNFSTQYIVSLAVLRYFFHVLIGFWRWMSQRPETGNYETSLLCLYFILVDKFTYLGSSISSTEKDIDTRLTKAWKAINRLSMIWKSDLTDKIKRSFFQAAILLNGCNTWTLTKRLEKKLDGNYTKMLRAILNKSWRQHPTKHQLYDHQPRITKTIQVRRTRYAGHCWRSRDELISDVLLCTPTYGRAKAGRLARTYIQQLCEDTGCSPEDLPEAMNDREKWRERVSYIRATSTTWWWWYIYIYISWWPDGSLYNSYFRRCRKICFSFPWIVPLYHWSLPYSAEC